MQNVEGDYHEILAYLDKHAQQEEWDPLWINGRGMETDEGDNLNVGLFSMMEDHVDYCACQQDGYDGCFASWTEFDLTTVWVIDSPVEVEDPDNSHLITF